LAHALDLAKNTIRGVIWGEGWEAVAPKEKEKKKKRKKQEKQEKKMEEREKREKGTMNNVKLLNIK